MPSCRWNRPVYATIVAWLFKHTMSVAWFCGSGDLGLGAMRPGTGRLGTGMRPGTASMGGATMVDVQVTDRPVTQQGISGMRPASAGPGRQVQDVTYFLGLLRNKISEITKEINKLKGDIEQMNKDNATYTSVRDCDRLLTCACRDTLVLLYNSWNVNMRR